LAIVQQTPPGGTPKSTIVVYDPNGNAYAISVVIDSDGLPDLQLAPAVPPAAGPSTGPSGVTGWSVSQIVKQVLGRTENRAANKPNFDPRTEFFLGLDMFAQEKHFWWRRKVASLQTIVGQQAYDLSQPNVGAGDLVEVEEMFIVNAAPQLYPYCVHPELDARSQIVALYGNSAVQQSISHSGYLLQPGAFQRLVLTSQLVQQSFTLAFTYYAVPMVTDTTQDTIPLVPPNLHYGLFDMFERRVLKFLYGQNDSRFIASDAEYKAFVLTAAKSKNFSIQSAIENKMGRGSIGSHGGRSRNYGDSSGSDYAGG
jgi:hypothetical protein